MQKMHSKLSKYHFILISYITFKNYIKKLTITRSLQGSFLEAKCKGIIFVSINFSSWRPRFCRGRSDLPRFDEDESERGHQENDSDGQKAKCGRRKLSFLSKNYVPPLKSTH